MRHDMKSVMRLLLAGGMVYVGVQHFMNPRPFVAIVPAWLPAHLALVLISGIFEVLGGVGLLVPRVRYAAAIGLVALYVAVFPANINMALHPPAEYVSRHALLIARLPMQLALIAWAWWVRR